MLRRRHRTHRQLRHSRRIGNGHVHSSRRWHVASAEEKGDASANIGPSIGSTVGVAGTLVVVGDATPVVVSVRAGTPMSWRHVTVRVVIRAGTVTATADVVGFFFS